MNIANASIPCAFSVLFSGRTRTTTQILSVFDIVAGNANYDGRFISPHCQTFHISINFPVVSVMPPLHRSRLFALSLTEQQFNSSHAFRKHDPSFLSLAYLFRFYVIIHHLLFFIISLFGLLHYVRLCFFSHLIVILLDEGDVWALASNRSYCLSFSYFSV